MPTDEEKTKYLDLILPDYLFSDRGKNTKKNIIKSVISIEKQLSFASLNQICKEAKESLVQRAINKQKKLYFNHSDFKNASVLKQKKQSFFL